MLLGLFEGVRGRLADWLAVFGRVPFFYYVVHLYIIHALAVGAGFAMTGVMAARPAIGLGLFGVYLVWLVVLILLYPLCRWFADLRERRTEWWWRYL
jgi:hypothetical protein